MFFRSKTKEIDQIHTNYAEDIKNLEQSKETDLSDERIKREEMAERHTKELERRSSKYASALKNKKTSFHKRMNEAISSHVSETKQLKEELVQLNNKLKEKEKELQRARQQSETSSMLKQKAEDSNAETKSHVSRHGSSVAASRETKSDVVPSPYAHRNNV